MENAVPWVEKYRPKTIDDIILSPLVEKLIRGFLDEIGGIHIILSGNPGVGKTTTIRCIAKFLLGDNLDEGYLELNAADDRGVKIMSTVVPPFCKKIVNFRCPKIILLDEADNLTQNCQNDIDNMIKEYGSKTKFMFTCNDSKKINEDIQSMCRIVHFSEPPVVPAKKYLKNICKKENISYTSSGIDMIFYVAGSDMRKSINDLQKTSYTFGSITKENVLKICNIPDPDMIKGIIEKCYTESINVVYFDLMRCIDDGYVFNDIINGFVNVVTNMQDIDEGLKIKLMCIINKTRIIITSKVNSPLQLGAMVARIYGVIRETI